jgi:hypothetical protein
MLHNQFTLMVKIMIIFYFCDTFELHIVTNVTITRQPFGKHIPEARQSTVGGPPLLGTKSLGTSLSNGRNTDNRRTVRGGSLSSARSAL